MTTNNSINNSLPSGWTMTSTLINELLYSSAANTITGLATANSGLLITSAGGVPSISTTIPAGITMPQPLIQGVINASNATAGNIGEFVTSNVPAASATALTSSVAKDITSISLTAGDWDVYGNITIAAPGDTLTGASLWVSLTSATAPDLSLRTVFGSAGVTFYQFIAGPVPYLRVNVSSTTTVYLSTTATFATGSATGCGSIFARRVR